MFYNDETLLPGNWPTLSIQPPIVFRPVASPLTVWAVNSMLPGQTIKVCAGAIIHTAIYGGLNEQGEAVIVDTTPEDGVSVRTLETFANNRQVIPFNYENAAPHEVILQRAYSKLGEPYDLMQQNCQDFTSWCATGIARSDQREFVGAIAVLGILTYALSRMAA